MVEMIQVQWHGYFKPISNCAVAFAWVLVCGSVMTNFLVMDVKRLKYDRFGEQNSLAYLVIIKSSLQCKWSWIFNQHPWHEKKGCGQLPPKRGWEINKTNRNQYKIHFEKKVGINVTHLCYVESGKWDGLHKEEKTFLFFDLVCWYDILLYFNSKYDHKLNGLN